MPKEVEASKEKNRLSTVDMVKLLDSLYQKSCNGIKTISPPIEKFAEDYLKKDADPKIAAKKMLNNQVTKCTTSGFITGFGGVITLPVSIPANIGSVLYVQMRMIACTAYMAGYDVNSDQTQTLVYACLAGVSVNGICKKFGVEFGKKLANAGIKKIPGKTLTKINQKIGFRFMTKFGEKGMINLGKMVPVVGAAINGGFDFVETKAIAKRAYKMFVEGDMTVGDDIKDDNDPIDCNFSEV